MTGRQSRPVLPLELIYECYRLLFPPLFFEHGSITQKPDWKDIEGLTLASKETREVILSLWFHLLRMSDLEDWKIVLRQWKRLYQWTRAIHYSFTVYKTPKSLLEPFIRLNSIRIDLPTTHVTGEGDFDFAAPEILQILNEGIPGNNIQHLEIHGITWLDPFVMRHIAEGLPKLRTLKLKQPFVWCGLCNTIGAPAFAAIPSRIVYDDGTGLPDAYARYLAPLQYLHTVKLTVACGHGVLPYDFLFSNGPPQETKDLSEAKCEFSAPGQPKYDAVLPTYDKSFAPGPTGRRSIGWSGECEPCMTQLLEDDAFRKPWMARRELSQDLTVISKKELTYPSRPRLLRRVEWELLEFSNQNWPGLLPNFAGQSAMAYVHFEA